jgi:hypothetical protein
LQYYVKWEGFKRIHAKHCNVSITKHEKFEDIKGAIKSRKSKDIQYNGQIV